MADFTAIYPPLAGAPVVGGITSINGDTTAAQLIVGSTGVTVGTAAGTTTIGLSLASIDHNSLANLTVGDPHTQYLYLLGRAGGQVANGGTAASENLTLRSTANATKGFILMDDGSSLRIGSSFGTLVESFGSATKAILTSIDGNATRPIAIANHNDNNVGGSFQAFRSRGTAASPTTLNAANLRIMNVQGIAYDGSAYQSAGLMAINSSEAWSGSARGSYITLSTNLDTTTTQAERFRVGNATTITGTIAAPNSLLWSGTTGLVGNIGTSTGASSPGTINAAIGMSMAGTSWAMIVSGTAIVTTDATPTLVTNIGTTTDTTKSIQVMVTARRTAGASGTAGDSASIFLEAMAKNIGGVVTLSTVGNRTYNEAGNPFTADLIVSGTNVVVQATGAAGNTVSWKANVTTGLM